MGATGNVLYELAQAMATEEGHSAAIALRTLARAGYSSLDEVDRASDWTLLSIPGLGVRRLSAIRHLTRPDWQPPPPQAVKAVNRLVAAARLALRFWPVEALSGMVQGSPPTVLAADSSAAARLALDLLSQATTRALCHCSMDALIEALEQAANGRPGSARRTAVGERARATTPQNSRSGQRTRAVDQSRPIEGTDRDSDHFAFSPEKRREIVRHYRTARQSGQVTNKDSWAHRNYGISGRTLLRYEHEYERAEARSQ